jgi:hypothetical protein
MSLAIPVSSACGALHTLQSDRMFTVVTLQQLYAELAGEEELADERMVADGPKTSILGYYALFTTGFELQRQQ